MSAEEELSGDDANAEMESVASLRAKEMATLTTKFYRRGAKSMLRAQQSVMANAAPFLA